MRKGRLLKKCGGIKARVLALFAVMFSTLAAFGQTPPPNDNYSNSITLTALRILFLAARWLVKSATIEDSQETAAFDDYFAGFITPTQAVWWNWTAPTNTVLTLQILNPTNNSSGYDYKSDLIAVYTATNGTLDPSGLSLPAFGIMPDDLPLAPQTLSLPVAAGSNYQIQLIGNSSVNYNIHLNATNTPLIITQPRSQTVYSNASATFYVIYAGVGQTNFAFQWYFNGTNLPGETTPILALNHIDSTFAGSYTVAVSNSACVTLSTPATLTVSQSNYPVALTAIGPRSNAFTFSLAGEVGRTYLLQSSTDLTNWVSENIFPQPPFYNLFEANVFFDTNFPQLLTAPNGPRTKFFRVAPYLTGTPDAEICINNLRQIRIAKMLWQRDYNASVIADPTETDIAPYFHDGILPFCPLDPQQSFDSSYAINNLETWPDCYISPTNHVLGGTAIADNRDGYL